MSYASEEQWRPTGVICPICGHESLAMGNKVKGHICIPDFLDTDVRFSTPSREDGYHRFAGSDLPPVDFQQMVKNVVGMK